MYGICFPSPDLWALPPLISLLLAAAAIIFSVLVLSLSLKAVNYIRFTAPVLPVALIVLLASNRWVSYGLDTSLLMLAANALCLAILFPTFDRFDTSRQFFILATFLSFGSMVEYSFLFMAPVYIVGGIIMKSFRIREFFALVLGLLAPYWILIGFGIVDIQDFRFPETVPLDLRLEQNPDLYTSLISVGLAGFVALLLSVNNSLAFLHGNSRSRCTHLAVSFTGFACLVLMAVDLDNIFAYCATVYLWCAFEIYSFLGLRNLKNPWPALCAFLVPFIVLFFFML